MLIPEMSSQAQRLYAMPCVQALSVVRGSSWLRFSFLNCLCLHCGARHCLRCDDKIRTQELIALTSVAHSLYIWRRKFAIV